MSVDLPDVGQLDRHGLAGLSMHKLGAQLGVTAMSLYKHVSNKDDLLDGVVESIWAEVETAAPSDPDWRHGYRHFAYAVREALRRHPNAAGLMTSRPVMPEPALRAVRAQITPATDAGIPPERAYSLLRTVISYACGESLAYIGWGSASPKVHRRWRICCARHARRSRRRGRDPVGSVIPMRSSNSAST